MIYNSLFKTLYGICKNQNISFPPLHQWYQPPSLPFTPHQKIILEFIKKKNLKNGLIEFLKFYEKQIEKEKNIIIISPGKIIKEKDSCRIIYANIYDGFIYIDKKKYLIYDHSLKTQLDKIKTQYIERTKNE